MLWVNSNIYLSKKNLKKIVKLSVPEAANRKAISLIVTGIENIAIGGVQDAGPGAIGITLSRTPPVPFSPKVEEIIVVATKSTWKRCKTNGVGAVDFPTSSAFHFCAGF